MVNSLEEYKETRRCYYSVLGNIEKINSYQSEIKLILEKIYDISKSDIYASYELFRELSYDLKVEFRRIYGDIFETYRCLYKERYQEDLEMIEKYDSERARRLKKQEINYEKK